MSDYLQELGSYLAANSTQLAPQRTLFLDSMPAVASSTGGGIALATSPTVSLTHAAGIAPVVAFTAGGAALMRRPYARVLVRSTGAANGEPSGANAYALTETIHVLLDSYPPNSQAVAGGLTLTVQPINDPHLEARDAQGRFIYTFVAAVWSR